MKEKGEDKIYIVVSHATAFTSFVEKWENFDGVRGKRNPDYPKTCGVWLLQKFKNQQHNGVIYKVLLKNRVAYEVFSG